MADDTPIELEGQLEFADYLRANYWYLARKFRLFIGILVFVGVAYPVMYLAGAFGASAAQPLQTNWGFLFVPALVAFMVFGTYLGARGHFVSNKASGQRLRFRFSSTGIDAAGPLSSGHSSWETIRDAHETRRYFLLFISNNQMYTIPKRYFSAEEQIACFRQLLKVNLGKRAKIRTGA